MNLLKMIPLCFLLLITQAEAATITLVEYYIDADPGRGSGTAFTIESGADISIQHTVAVTELSDGMHRLYVRALDSDGTWSIPASRPFVKTTPTEGATIEEVEYYFDTDPGLGNGTTLSTSAAADLSQSFSADVSTLDAGLHNLYVRARDEHDRWSMPTAHPIMIIEPPAITMLEYFFDEDPGYGNGTGISISSSPDITTSFTADTTGLGLGDHTMYIRCATSDGARGIVYSYTFPITEVLGGAVSGTITTDAFGISDIGVANATIAINGTSYEVTTDGKGNFVLPDLPDGTYTATITSPDTLSQTIEFSVSGGYDVILTDIPKLTVITSSDYEQAIAEESDKWDANNDGVIGLEEAINALQVTTGIVAQE